MWFRFLYSASEGKGSRRLNYSSTLTSASAYGAAPSSIATSSSASRDSQFINNHLSPPHSAANCSNLPNIANSNSNSSSFNAPSPSTPRRVNSSSAAASNPSPATAATPNAKQSVPQNNREASGGINTAALGPRRGPQTAGANNVSSSSIL